MARSSHAPARSCVLGASAVIAILLAALAALAALLTAATPGGASPLTPIGATATAAPSPTAAASVAAAPTASPTATVPAAVTVGAGRGHHADDGPPALRADAARVPCPAPGERRSPPPALGTQSRTGGTPPPAVDVPAVAVPTATATRSTYHLRLRAPPGRSGT